MQLTRFASLIVIQPQHSLRLAGSKMAQEDSGTKCKRVHVLCGSGKHLPSLHHGSTLCLCLTRCLGGQPCIARSQLRGKNGFALLPLKLSVWST